MCSKTMSKPLFFLIIIARILLSGTRQEHGGQQARKWESNPHLDYCCLTDEGRTETVRNKSKEWAACETVC